MKRPWVHMSSPSRSSLPPPSPPAPSRSSQSTRSERLSHALIGHSYSLFRYKIHRTLQNMTWLRVCWTPFPHSLRHASRQKFTANAQRDLLPIHSTNTYSSGSLYSKLFISGLSMCWHTKFSKILKVYIVMIWYICILGFFFNFYWRIVDLQCCAGFCYMGKWFSYTNTYSPSYLDSSPVQIIRVLSRGPCVVQQVISYLFYT